MRWKRKYSFTRRVTREHKKKKKRRWRWSNDEEEEQDAVAADAKAQSNMNDIVFVDSEEMSFVPTHENI